MKVAKVGAEVISMAQAVVASTHSHGESGVLILERNG